MTKKRIIWGTSILILIILGFSAFSGKKTEESLVVAAKKDLREEVFATGTVTSRQEVKLAFEKGGRINAVYVSVGDTVSRGKLLASIDASIERANVEEARAELLSKESALQKMRLGTRSEQLKVTEAKLAKATQTLAVNNESLPETIDIAFTKAETAVYQYTESIFSDDRTTSPKLNFSTTDHGALSSAINTRVAAETALLELARLKDQSATSTQSIALLTSAKTALFVIQDFLIATTNAVNNSILVDADKITYKTDIATARGLINAAITEITTLSQAISLAEAEQKTAARELELEKAGATAEDIAGAEAAVASAAAKILSAEASVAQKMLYAPIDGTITTLTIDQGEIIGANEHALTIINGKAFEIDVSLPEADIANIAVGQKATVTLDAYGSSVPFEAHVIAIEPAATLVEGIPTYKTTFALDTIDARIKSGMTANLTVSVAERLGVLSIPERALRFDETKQAYVLVKTDAEPKEVPVTTGLRSTRGDVEILSGLSEGDSIILK